MLNFFTYCNQSLPPGVQYVAPNPLLAAVTPSSGSSLTASTNSTARSNVTLVFYIGGLTYPELAALRLVSKTEGIKSNCLDCTEGKS